MKRTRFSEEQIVRIVKSFEDGMPVVEAIRQRGVSGNTLYWWRQKYARLEVTEAKRRKTLEDENGRLKRVGPT